MLAMWSLVPVPFPACTSGSSLYHRMWWKWWHMMTKMKTWKAWCLSPCFGPWVTHSRGSQLPSYKNTKGALQYSQVAVFGQQPMMDWGLQPTAMSEPSGKQILQLQSHLQMTAVLAYVLTTTSWEIVSELLPPPVQTSMHSSLLEY